MPSKAAESARSAGKWNSASDVSPLAADRLDGAEAIAAYLGMKLRRVIYLRESKSSCPIRKQEGLGLYAFRSELDAWMRAPESLASKPQAA